MPAGERASRRGLLTKHTAPLVGAVLLVSWVAAFAWWALVPNARMLAIDIPRGAALQVAAGEVPDGVPDSLFIRIGDTLEIDNHDAIAYQVGPAFIPPSTFMTVPVTSAFFAGSTVFCSFHPGGALAVTPRSKPGFLLTFPIALASGIPLSLAAIAVMAVVGRLESPEDAEAAARVV